METPTDETLVLNLVATTLSHLRHIRNCGDPTTINSLPEKIKAAADPVLSRMKRSKSELELPGVPNHTIPVLHHTEAPAELPAGIKRMPCCSVCGVEIINGRNGMCFGCASRAETNDDGTGVSVAFALVGLPGPVLDVTLPRTDELKPDGGGSPIHGNWVQPDGGETPAFIPAPPEQLDGQKIEVGGPVPTAGG